jgi:rhodanese-related sulfurtransferase
MTDDKRISPHEASAKLKEGYIYVDVRTVEEFEQGHPKGALNVPLLLSSSGGMAPNPNFTKVMSATFSLDSKLIVGCKAGGRSLKAREVLVREGYTDVLDQRAGWDGARDAFGQISEKGWSREGLPAETLSGEGQAYAELLRRAAAKG